MGVAVAFAETVPVRQPAQWTQRTPQRVVPVESMRAYAETVGASGSRKKGGSSATTIFTDNGRPLLRHFAGKLIGGSLAWN